MVTIPKDYENRLLDGNQVTAFLQLYMQGVISQETLLQIMAKKARSFRLTSHRRGDPQDP